MTDGRTDRWTKGPTITLGTNLEKTESSKSGTGLQSKGQTTMTVQQFQQIFAQQKAQQQQQQVLQQIISTVGTQPVGTSAGATTVNVGGAQIITSALQQQQQQQGIRVNKEKC